MCTGRRSGWGWGSAKEKEAAQEEAFKDCGSDKQGLLALSDVTGRSGGGVGRGREREEEVRLQSPEPGDTQMLADGTQRVESKLHLADWEHGAERAGFTDPGRTFGRKGNGKVPLTESAPTPAG